LLRKVQGVFVPCGAPAPWGSLCRRLAATRIYLIWLLFFNTG